MATSALNKKTAHEYSLVVSLLGGTGNPQEGVLTSFRLSGRVGVWSAVQQLYFFGTLHPT